MVDVRRCEKKLDYLDRKNWKLNLDNRIQNLKELLFEPIVQPRHIFLPHFVHFSCNICITIHVFWVENICLREIAKKKKGMNCPWELGWLKAIRFERRNELPIWLGKWWSGTGLANTRCSSEARTAIPVHLNSSIYHCNASQGIH